MRDHNYTSPVDSDLAPYEERLKLLQSTRIEAAIATHERALKYKSVRDQLVIPHEIEEGQWVLVRHENPQKFEAKWFRPYQVVQRMLLGTYRLVDPNGRELAALMHGNRLIKANIRTADELQDLWTSLKAKDKLRKRNRNIELISSYSENTDILDQYLQDDNEDDENDLDEMPELDLEMEDVVLNRSLKRKREIQDHIVVRPLPKRRKRVRR